MRLFFAPAFALACGEGPPPPPPAVAYRAALVTLDSDAAAGAEACLALPKGPWRVDCLGAAAEALARLDSVAASDLCEELASGLWKDECHFQVAEASRDPARCAAAGRFEQDCRMHHWSRLIAGRLGNQATPASSEHRLEVLATEAGFADTDDRPWVAAFRLLGARMAPLNRSACDGLSVASRRQTCRQALRDHYNDLLNHARDTGTFPCGGNPLTGRLAYQADPGLDALVEHRRQEDLCP